jgi:riboflavin biosynthesis pyrimidine reductase
MTFLLILRIVLFVVTFITIVIAITDYGIFFVTATAPSASAAPIPVTLEPNTIVTIDQLLKQVQTWQRIYHHHDHQNDDPQHQPDGDGHYNHFTQSLTARPFVTATFAQSVDGYMSPFIHQESGNTTTKSTEHASTHSNYPLSSHESLVLTHGLRSIHDGILIGGRTLLLDNPRLTNRLWGIPTNINNCSIHDEGNSSIRTMTTSKTCNNDTTTHLPSQNHQPQPVIIDPNLRYIQQLLRDTNGTMNLRHPIICCTFDAASSIQLNQYHYHRYYRDHCFRNYITNNTIRLLPCQGNNNRSRDYATSVLNMTNVFHQLYHQYNLRSIMVEGGAHTLSTLFTATPNVLVNAIIVTIAPQFLSSGIRPTFGRTVGRTNFSSCEKHHFRIDTLRLVPSSTSFILLGNDATLIARCDQKRPQKS